MNNNERCTVRVLKYWLQKFCCNWRKACVPVLLFIFCILHSQSESTNSTNVLKSEQSKPLLLLRRCVLFWCGNRRRKRTECPRVETSLNVMAHAQKPDFVFRRNGRVHLNRRGPKFSRLLAAELCASAVVMLDTPCSEVVWRVLATHSIRQFPLHFPSRASPCAITFQL